MSKLSVNPYWNCPHCKGYLVFLFRGLERAKKSTPLSALAIGTPLWSFLDSSPAGLKDIRRALGQKWRQCLQTPTMLSEPKDHSS